MHIACQAAAVITATISATTNVIATVIITFDSDDAIVDTGPSAAATNATDAISIAIDQTGTAVDERLWAIDHHTGQWIQFVHGTTDSNDTFDLNPIDSITVDKWHGAGE